MMKKIIVQLCLFSAVLFLTGCNPVEDYLTDPDSETYYYATFKINGVEKKFKSSSSHGLLNDYYGWSAGWGEHSDPLDDEEGDVGDYFNLHLPSDVNTASEYTQAYSSHFFNYFISGGPNSYRPDASETFTVTITEWNEEGGIVSGTFEGTLKNPVDLPETITITEGKFETINNGVDEY